MGTPLPPLRHADVLNEWSLNRINLILDQECLAIFSAVQKVKRLNILNIHQVKIKTLFCSTVPKLILIVGSIFECKIKYFGHLENLGYLKFCQIV